MNEYVFFVKYFSGTLCPRILKFGTGIRYDRLYCVVKNQPHLSIFLSFQQFFHLVSSASMSATIFKFCTYNEDKQVYLYCEQNHGAEIFPPYFFPFFYLSRSVM